MTAQTAHNHSDKHKSCKELLGDLSLYIDGEAEADLCQEIEQHMADCENCRVVVDTLAKTVFLYHGLEHNRMPGEARRRLYKALDLSDYLDEPDPASSSTNRKADCP
nr:zf-HC2 domain-containing protein [Anaerolineae bacterium]